MTLRVAVMICCMALGLHKLAFATEQSPDPMLCFGEKACCLGAPLEVLWPDWRQRPQFDEISTANRKGYVAHWEIREARLHLVKLEGRIKGRRVKPELLLEPVMHFRERFFRAAS